MLNIITSQFKKPRGAWGVLISSIMYYYNKKIYYEIEKHASFHDGISVLEIGFGPGFGIKHLLTKYKMIYFGVDFSELLYANVKRKYEKLIRNNILKLVFGDFLTCEFDSQSMNIVFFSNVTYFWKELSVPFEKILKVLKINGELVFYMENKNLLEKESVSNNENFYKHDVEDIRNELKEIGFTNIECINVFDNNNERFIVKAKKNG